MAAVVLFLSVSDTLTMWCASPLQIASPLGILRTQDTRPTGAPPGSGWQHFKVSGLVRKSGEALGSFHLTKGHHVLHVHYTSKDTFGVSLDRITIVDLGC